MGSRGDIRLGVSVTYSDINNSAMLIEIARKKGIICLTFRSGHISSRTLSRNRSVIFHCFLTMRRRFNESFLLRSENMLADLLPQYSSLQNVLKVIDVSRVSGGLVLDVLMNDE